MFSEYKYKLLNLFFGYSTSESRRGIFVDEKNPHEGASAAGKFINILSREMYEETYKEYPINSAKEIDKVIRLGEFGDRSYHLTPDKSASTTRAVLWRFPFKKFKSLFNVPETLLLSLVLEEKIIYRVPCSKGFYFFVQQQGKFYSSFKTGLIQSPEVFANAVGVSSKNVVTIEDIELTGLLKRALSKLKLSMLIPLRRQKEPSKSIFESFDYKHLLPGVALVFAYFLISSAFIKAKQVYVKAELDYLQEDSIKLLDSRKTINEKLKFIEAANGVAKEQIPPFKIWEILLPIFEQGVLFKAIRTEQQTAYISGTAPNALKVMELLNQNESVKNAQFKGSQRVTRKGESFSIEFQYE